MAISITWATGVIFVPKADTTLIQAAPTEIRELNLNTLRLTLKALEASSEGMAFLDTHFHNPPVTVGGVTLARVVAIINGYTVTFEDGQYAVNLVGANSNVGDVTNVNQVSIRSGNSAGLIQTREIEHASFNGAVTVDVTSSFSGTLYPIGTQLNPVNNMADALLIEQVRGFGAFNVIGDLMLDDGALALTQKKFIGQSPQLTSITVDAVAQVTDCIFENVKIGGTLDGGSTIRGCMVLNLSYVDGFIESSMLMATITLSGVQRAHFVDCRAGSTTGAVGPIIDLGGSGGMGLHNYNGPVTLKNLTSNKAVLVDLNSGHISLDSTITQGDFSIHGVGGLEDNTTPQAGLTVESTLLVNPETVSAAVWDKLEVDHTAAGSFGAKVSEGPSPQDSQRLLDVYRILGLDASEPLTVSATSREAGGTTIQQTITVNAGVVTVTRV